MALDILITHPAPERVRRAQSHPAAYATLIVVALLVLGWAVHGSADAEKGLLDDTEQGDLRLLVLGVESGADKSDCPRCPGYIEQFGAAAREEGRSVQINGAGGDPTTWPLTDLTAVTALLQNDNQFRELVRTADIVLIDLGDEQPAAIVDTGLCFADRVVRSPCAIPRSARSSRRDHLLTAIDDLRRPDTTVVLLT